MMEDHNLLIRLDQKVSDLKVSVDNLTNGTVAKITLLERDKADSKTVEELESKVNNDIEKRLTDLEITRVDFRSKITNTNRYLTFLLGLGLLIVGMLLYHLSGYHL